MGIKQAQLDMIGEFPGGWDAIAAALGFTSRMALENRIYERKGQSLSTHDSMQMQAFTGTTLFAEAIAELSGGYFTKLPDIDFAHEQDIPELFIKLASTFGKLATTHMQATADGEIDDKEKAELNRIKQELHGLIEVLFMLSLHVYHKDGAK